MIQLTAKSSAMPLRVDLVFSLLAGLGFYFLVERDLLLAAIMSVAVGVTGRFAPVAPRQTKISLGDNVLKAETTGLVIGARDRHWERSEIKHSSVWAKRGRFFNSHLIYFRLRNGKRHFIEFTGVEWAEVHAFALRLKQSTRE